MERVVITGMGAITPVGNDVPTFWESLKTGKCGIGPITKFDVSDFKVKLGAEVKDFDPTQYMEKRIPVIMRPLAIAPLVPPFLDQSHSVPSDRLER